MKNFSKLILIIFFIFSANNLYSQMGFQIIGGLSTPNDKVNDIYNQDLIKGENALGKLWRDGVPMGYHLGVQGRLALAHNVLFRAGILYNKFPQSDIEIRDTATNKLLVTLQTVENIIPINVGINFYLFRDFIALYATGDLSYNYITSSVTYKDIPFAGLDLSPTDSRVGFSFGAGIDFDVSLITVNLEGKYNIANLIGKLDDEKTKSYFTLSLGVVFGNPYKSDKDDDK